MNHRARLENALPCPFCGSLRIVKGERYFALCVDCGATGPERSGDKGGVNLAKKDWNSRVPLDRQLNDSIPVAVTDGNAAAAR